MTWFKPMAVASTYSDGNVWRRDSANPVLTLGASGAWDDTIVGRPTFTVVNDTIKVLYSGSPDSASTWQIGLATGSDFGSLSKSSSNPVLTTGASGAWDDNRVYESDVVEYNGTYYQPYIGHDVDTGTHRLGMAESSDTDFTTWTKDSNNPILTPSDLSGTYTINQIRTACIVENGGTFYIYLTGRASNGNNYFYLYTSSDTDWSTLTKYSGNPIFSQGSSGAWDSGIIGGQHVWIDSEGTWHMWYDGHQDSAKPVHSVGHATSTDGQSWTRDADNPVFSPDTVYNGQWDGGQTYQRALYVHNGTLSMLYSGTPTDPRADEQIGLSQWVSESIPSISGTVIEDWEDPSAEAAYSGQTGMANIGATSATTGKRALRMTADTNAWITATSGLNAFLDAGETMRTWVRTGGTSTAGPLVGYFLQSNGSFPQNGYYVELSRNNGDLRVVRYDGSYTVLGTPPSVSYSDDTLYELEINPTTGGTHNISLYDSTGSSVASYSPSDSTYSDGGHAFGMSQGNTGTFDSVHHDSARLI